MVVWNIDDNPDRYWFTLFCKALHSYLFHKKVILKVIYIFVVLPTLPNVQSQVNPIVFRHNKLIKNRLTSMFFA